MATSTVVIVFMLFYVMNVQNSHAVKRHAIEDTGRVLRSLFRHQRQKRFDFSMFGCGSCTMECHSDLSCIMKKGPMYKCDFDCCTFRCVVNHRLMVGANVSLNANRLMNGANINLNANRLMNGENVNVTANNMNTTDASNNSSP